MKVFSIRLSTQGHVSQRDYRDVISSHLPFMEWHVQHTFRRKENTGIFKSSIRYTHITIGNRAWPSLNGGSLEIIIVYLTTLKIRHFWDSS